MRYKLIALDIDGTLLDSKSVLTERTLRTIKSAERSGVRVCLVSGRSPRSVSQFAAQLSLNGPMVACNGGAIVDPETLEPFHAETIPRASITPVLQAWEAAGLSFYAYRCTATPPDIYYCRPSTWEPEAAWLAAEGANVAKVDSILTNTDWEPLRIMFGHSAALVDQASQLAEPLLDHQKVRVFYSQYQETSYYEIYPITACKSNGLRFLADLNNITREEIIAVGDGLNDLDMLEYAGLGVAMGNAHPAVKEKADMVIGHHDEDGLAMFLQELLLKS